MKPAWYDLTTQIGGFGHDHGPTEAALDRFLKGIDVNAPNEDGRLLLCEMAWEGRSEPLAYLLKKGADPNKVGRPYVNGPALGYVVDSSSTKAADKAKLVKQLLDAGADPNCRIGDKGTLLDHMVAQAVDAAKPHKNYTSDSLRYFKRMLQGYLATIPLLVAAGGTMSDASRKQLAKLLPKSTAKAKPFDPKKAKALIKKASRDSIYALCETHLGTPEALAHPDWAALVKGAVDAGQSFRAVAKQVYGKEVSLADDEGWLCQSWDNYVTLDAVFELLAKEAVARHPKWADSVAYALKRRDAQDATDHTEDAVGELFGQPWVRKHPDFKKLHALLS